MASTKGPFKKGRHSLKHSCNFSEAKRKLSRISDHEHVEYAVASHRRQDNSKHGDTKLSQILSRDKLISVVDLIWDRSDLISSLHEGKLDVLKRDEVGEFRVSADSSARWLAEQNAKSQLRPTPPKFQLVRVAEKMRIPVLYHQNYSQSIFSYLSGVKSVSGSCKSMWATENLYSWIEVVSPKGDAEVEKQQNFQDGVSSPVRSKSVCASGNANICGSVFARLDSESHSTPMESRSPLLSSVTESPGDTSTSRFMDANSLFMLYKDRCANNEVVNIVSSKCSTDCHSKISSSGNSPHEDSLSMVGNKELLEKDRKDQENDVSSSSTGTPTHAFAKHRHAFAGALAGVSVSLCLHPLDTVKTMIQSCRLQEKSLCYTGRSVISERGVSGLYRGVASSIAASAPISALYTFTYESVKGALVPVFPKECCSLAHCVAGGSASVATSFIFTPSERIKQQMQVSSQYRSCWTAFVGIIQKGGLLSLYAGWSAVLCRNIPHSIIKFYVYENMKRMVFPSLGPCGQAAQHTTLQTLICGGLAGSAAAFFTTPFDVVKTRLQTQIPGSKTQHPSVYQALQSIRKQEGPRGLYRGLFPRLVMYMSQGAIFFASYEFYKSILSLEDLSARWHKTNPQWDKDS